MAEQTKRKAQGGRGRNKSPAAKKEGQGKKQGQGSNGSSRSKSDGRGRNKSPIRNQGGEKTRPEGMYEDYTLMDPGEISDTDEPDVVLDIPIVKVDEIHFELDDLEARVALHAEVLDLVKLSVGVHAQLGKVELDIKGVEAQALLRARLDHVTAIIDRVLTTLDRNPELLESIGKSLEQVGEGAGKGVGQIGQGAGRAVEDVGEGAEGAVKDVGKGAGGAVEDVGEGAGGAVENVGEGAGGAVEDVGGGAGKAVGEVGEGAGQAVGGLGQGVGQLAGLAGGAAGKGGNGGGGEGQGGNGLTAGMLAKEAAKLVVKELGSAASDEAKELGLAATHKAAELGERRRQRRAERHHATEAALRQAEEAGLDLDDVDGSGAEGRITVRDVQKAASG
jgi:e3 binding domain